MPRPKPPSRIDTVTTPLFGICWFGDPGDGTDIVAFCGGGGSAATGVKNLITVRIAEEEEDLQISTGDQIGVALSVVRNPLTRNIYLYVALGKKVKSYSLPDGNYVDELELGEEMGDNVNALSLNSMTDHIAIGTEDGTVKVYSIDGEKMNSEPVHVLLGHSKAVCSVAWSPRGDTLVSSAKDGTARVWKGGESFDELKCSIIPTKGPPPKRLGQILVRGCAFGDLEGNLIYTVASGRRGAAFLSAWELNGDHYDCAVRTECSPCPVSAMCLSGDAGLLVLGATDGTVILWGVERWKPMKKFPEVHDLPVTCIAARPFPVPLKGDENEIQMHAISASADSQLAWLTLQRKSKGRKTSPKSLKSTVNSLLRTAIMMWILYPLANEIWDKCEDEWENNGIAKAWQCIRDDVLIAPDSRPGILVPPH
jgi:WD40 repeat protein